METITHGRATGEATEVLGYTSLRENQLLVKYFARGFGGFMSMPTGSEKSFCYCFFNIHIHT